MKVPASILILLFFSKSSDSLILGQSGSAFTRSICPKPLSKIGCTTRGDMLMYDDPGSSSQEPTESGSNSGQVWSALASTERWITDTTSGENSPFARKEVSYVCETSESTEEIVGTIFRRLKDMREIGDSHGKNEDERRAALGSKYKPVTHRETLMMVMTANQECISEFSIFEKIVHTINMARRNARELVIDPSQNDKENSDILRWITSVSLGHLHPNYGEEDMKKVIAEAKEQKKSDENEIIIPEMEVYRIKRLLARRSPYPSLVLEVKCTPLPPMDESTAPPMVARQANVPLDEENEVTRNDIKKLEALFGKAATFEDEEVDEKRLQPEHPDAFWNDLGETDGIDQITFETPIDQGQRWIANNDHAYNIESSSFIHTDLRHVDAAHEFVFSSIAADRRTVVSNTRKQTYLLMPNFVSSSATSFEKFLNEVKKIMATIPGISDGLDITIFHRESIEKEKRSPIPIFALQWNGKPS
eukprot:CAMPEP_0194357184 /NCGR_PEP_ID=MMETSP0174-20130528/4707_1 /TAXON_ID=216777 /ORGANISM="Proboscia alata, Strain PI-D3" /LENGTH=475 /DNA_ID=CAMNT_0039127101 /DNA_START=221 /DNA_END=1648 /DNA_ORIENTATION=+